MGDGQGTTEHWYTNSSQLTGLGRMVSEKKILEGFFFFF